MSPVIPSKKNHRLPAAEARLLKQVNRGFSAGWWDHYHELIGKRDDSQLSASEYRELIRLNDEIERRQAKRVEALAKLAKRRGQSLSDLMRVLGVAKQTNG